MSDELESVGALSTATLAAVAIDGGNGHDGHEAHGNCANCQAPLTGPFCRMCGQQAHIHRSLLHLIEELLHGLFHFEARGWRTIPLLIFKPGVLTRRFIDGQRKTYVSPLALFLFMVFLMFFVASLGGSEKTGDGKGLKTADAIAAIQSNIAEQTKEATDAKAAVEKASAALEEARKQGGDLSELQDALDEALQDQKNADEDLKRFKAESAKLLEAIELAKETNKEEHQAAPVAASASASTTATSAGRTATGSSDEAHTSQLQAAIDAVAHERGVKGADWSWVDRVSDKLKNKNWIHSDVPEIDAAIKHSLNNPELALYKLKNTTYKYSFMLVPISLPFLWLMFFWRRGVAMFDHAVFVLYSLCFMSLLFDLVMLTGMAGWGGFAAMLAIFVPPIHMFVHLRGTYGLGIFSALWRTVALTFVASIVLMLFLILVLVLSMH